MKKSLILILIAVFSVSALAQDIGLSDRDEDSITDTTSKYNLFDKGDFVLDLKIIDPEKGFFGFDHKLDLTHTITNLPSLENERKQIYRNVNLNLSSRGYWAVRGEDNPTNSIINEVNIEAFPLYSSPIKSISTASQNWEEIDETDPEFINETSELASKLSSPFWFYPSLRMRYETTQDFKDYNFAIGGNISFTSSYLSWILDLPFRLLRVDDNNNYRQIDLSLGYDYVMGVKNTKLYSDIENNSSLNRINLKAEWETGIFTKNQRLIFLYDSYYNIDQYEIINNSGKDFNSFFMIKLDHFLSANEDSGTLEIISIKYTKGELPPNFEEGFVLGGGFTILF